MVMGRKLLIDDNPAKDTNTVVGFLTAHSNTRANKIKLWSRRRMIVFVLGGSVVGWSLLYLHFHDVGLIRLASSASAGRKLPE